MKCVATIRRIMKAGPCYAYEEVEGVFRKFKVKGLTPKILGNLRLRYRIQVTAGSCTCSSCTDSVRIWDRIWVLLYACGLRKETLLAFIKKEAWSKVKNWREAPTSLIDFFRTDKRDTLRVLLDDIQLSSGLGQQRYIAREYVERSLLFEYRILNWIIGPDPRKQKRYLKKLVELCEAQK